MSYLQHALKVIDDFTRRGHRQVFWGNPTDPSDFHHLCMSLLMKHSHVSWTDWKRHLTECSTCQETQIEQTELFLLNPSLSWDDFQEVITWLVGDTVYDMDPEDDGDRIRCCFEIYCKNPNLQYSTILQNPQLPWPLFYIAGNASIPFEYIEQHCIHHPLSYIAVSTNPNVTWEIIQSHPTHSWDYNRLSRNPNITWEIIQQNIHLPWNFSILSTHPSLRWDQVQSHLHLPWDFHEMGKHVKISLSELFSHPIWKTHPSWQQNPVVTWEVIEANPHIMWDYEYVSLNPNITWDIVQQHLDKPWVLSKLCHNQMSSYYYQPHKTKMTRHILPEMMNNYYHPKHYARLHAHGHLLH